MPVATTPGRDREHGRPQHRAARGHCLPRLVGACDPHPVLRGHDAGHGGHVRRPHALLHAAAWRTKGGPRAPTAKWARWPARWRLPPSSPCRSAFRSSSWSRASDTTVESLLGDPAFRAGLVMQGIAAVWSCAGLYRALADAYPGRVAAQAPVRPGDAALAGRAHRDVHRHRLPVRKLGAVRFRGSLCRDEHRHRHRSRQVPARVPGDAVDADPRPLPARPGKHQKRKR